MTEAQLRAFVAVAEAGGFGPAAGQLAMTQSGISRAVGSLEQELGGALFDRSRGRIALTVLGERAIARARAMLAEGEALRQEAIAARGAAGGRVRLGTMPSVTAGVLPAVLADLRRHNPAIDVRLFEGHDEELVEWLRAGTVDVAVVTEDGPDLDCRPLTTDDLLAVVGADHPLAARDAVPCDALADEPFILTRAGCERIVLAALAAAGVTPRVAYEVAEARTIMTMVAEGLGVSVMPRLSTRSAPDGVAFRELAPAAHRTLHVATLAARDPSPAVRTLLDHTDAWRTRHGAERSLAAQVTDVA